MKKTILTASLAATFTFGMVGCDVEQTQEGELPTVDFDGGAIPAYDVDGPDVDVSTQESTVAVPDVDVDTKEKTITTPDVDITLPEDE